MENQSSKNQNGLFVSCLDKGFWKSAVNEVVNVRSLVLCALFTALRIIAQAPFLKITIIPNELEVNFGFLFNCLGAMLYGPILGIISGAISDTVGFFLFSTGTYFVPYMFIAMASSFIFGIFLYKQEVTSIKLLLANFTMMVICNLLLSPLALYLYYLMVLGKTKVFATLILAEVAVNLASYPLKSWLLIVFIRAISLPLAKMGYLPVNKNNLRFTAREGIFLALMTLLAVACVLIYVFTL